MIIISSLMKGNMFIVVPSSLFRLWVSEDNMINSSNSGWASGVRWLKWILTT